MTAEAPAIFRLLHTVMVEDVWKNVILVVASMIPVVELRGAVPLGVLLGAKWYETLLFTAAGNFIPIPFVLKHGEGVLRRLRRFSPVRRFLEPVDRFMERKSDSFRRNAALTLILVIAAPFTGIGAWGASIIANILHLDKRNSLAAIIAGILISGVFTTLAAYGFVQTLRMIF